MQPLSTTGYHDCHACSLCLLPCPMWHQRRDLLFSPQGIAKALQHGASPHELADPITTCIDCGACDVICPQGIDLSAMIAGLRQQTGLPQQTLPSEAVLSGFIISCDPYVQQQLGASDLYIIDAAALHKHYSARIGHYDALRHRCGCRMNLDLNRMAIATGAGGHSAQAGHFDLARQLQWLLQGHTGIERIVVENKLEIEPLSAITDIAVFHIAELMEHATAASMENTV